MGETGKRRTGVKSDETLLSIVEYLRETDGAGVTELAERLDLAKSTVHSHLATMQEHGYVVKRGDVYRLGLEFFSDGQYVRNQFEVYRAARPVVDDLVAETGEMAWLLVHQNGRVMYLYGRPGRTDVDAHSLIGSWAYMHSNSAGKAMLAHLPESAIDEVIERHGLPQRTENTITNREALEACLEQVHERGYALNLGEDLEGIHAIGVPLVFEGELHGAIAIAGPAHRATRERCESEFAEALFAARNDVELNLAYG